MTIILGVDAGGTRTVAAVARDTEVLARREGTAGAVRPGRAMAAANAIASTARQALHATGQLRAAVLVVGAAGVGRDEERHALRDALRLENLADRILVTTDIAIALRAALGTTPGMVLLAGTGSFAVAQRPDGTQVRQGGYGWRMGDEGSAYALGHAALRAVGRAEGGRGEATALTAALQRQTRSTRFDDLVRWSVVASPAEVAALAPAVLTAAESGDAVASELVREAAVALTSLARALRPTLPGPGTVPVALAGGMMGFASYRAAVLEELAQVPGLQVRETTVDPVQGALALARDAIPTA